MLVKVAISKIRLGMFIAELDRPWIDTPFLIQGFMLDDEKELSRLRRYCDFVYVDDEKSTPGLFSKTVAVKSPGLRSIPASRTSTVIVTQSQAGGNPEVANTLPEERSHSQRNPEATLTIASAEEVVGSVSALQSPAATKCSLPANSRSTLGEQFASLLDRFAGLVGRSWNRSVQDSGRFAPPPDGLDDNPPVPARQSFIPDSIEIVAHREINHIEEEIAPARHAYSRAEDVVNQVVEDIRGGKLPVIEQLDEVISDVVDSILRNPDALMWVARLKQQDTVIYGHSLQVSVYLVAFGRHLGLPKEYLGRLGITGLLLDIGKTKMPRTVLGKRRALTKDEFDLIKEHVRIGLDILKPSSNLHPEVLEGIAQHHEREDGSGYPKGLRAGTIGMFGRMAAIADSFVAMTNPRPYADTISPYEALRKLNGWGNLLFHGPMVEQFGQSIGVFPVGSLIELSSGEVAVVIRQSKVRRLKPRVLVICGPDKKQHPHPFTLDLLYQPLITDREPVTIKRGLPTGAYGLDAREYFLS